jgi:hypothetical protein
MCLDPKQPQFALMMVRNPFHPSAAAVGFLYWFRDRELRQQGVVFHGSRSPRARVWWTARSEAPYEWGIVTTDPARDGRLELLLLRLNETATFWVLVQYEDQGPDLGGPGEAVWAEIDREGAPELIVWTHAQAESTFEECTDCPHLVREQIFVDRAPGFELFDGRLVPSPYAAFTLFIRLLQHGERAAAARLLEQPARIEQAVAAGWARRGRGTWSVEYGEEGETWPRWLALRFKGPNGPVHYIVHFTLRDGRWLIADWVVPRRPATGSGSSPGARRPNGRKP